MVRFLFVVSALFVLACGRNVDAVSSLDAVSDAVLYSCKGSTSDFEFSFVDDRSGTSTYGDLTVAGKEKVRVTCNRAKDEMRGFDVPKPIWNCKQSSSIDGGYLVDADFGGFVPLMYAKVRIAQIYPLKPLDLATLTCKKKSAAN